MSSVYWKLTKQLEHSIEAMGKQYDRKRKSVKRFKRGKLVMLNGKNIHINHRWKKLKDKMYGPFEIISTGKNQRYCKLRLPDTWRIHPAYNLALLEWYQGTDPK